MKIETFKSKVAYEEDYFLWLLETANHLKNRDFLGLDVANLLEEIEDMARRQKQAVKSNLRILLMHLLKYQYQPGKRSNSWKATIREHRNRLEDNFADSPSLKNYFEEVLSECYSKARNLASDETNLPINTFPSELPFTLQEVLDFDYLPNKN